MSYRLTHPNHGQLAPCVVAAIDAELRNGKYHSLDAERLRFARWILTAPADELDNLLGELEKSGTWQPSEEGY